MASRKLRCAVIGAANIDIGGFPTGEALMRDSNPGRIRLSAGGVGRNIAANLARLCAPVRLPGMAPGESRVNVQLVAALGDDAFAEFLRSDLAKAGVGLDYAFTFDGAASSSYLFISDAMGDMLLAVNDMDICARLTPEALSTRLDALNAMDVVVIDANLPEASVAYLAENLRAPLIADAVSAAKARKLLPTLPHLHTIKANALEAEVLTGVSIIAPADAARAARRLVELGAKRAYITLGDRGACWGEGDRTGFAPIHKARMVNATGVGDAFTAALAWMALAGADIENAAIAGNAAASIAVESADTVSQDMNAAALFKRMSEIEETMEKS